MTPKKCRNSHAEALEASRLSGAGIYAKVSSPGKEINPIHPLHCPAILNLLFYCFSEYFYYKILKYEHLFVTLSGNSTNLDYNRLVFGGILH